MMLTTRQLQRFSWLAIAALLMLALAPGISHAIAASQGSTQLVELCTSRGIITIAVADTAPAEYPDDAQVMHCAFCSLQNHAQMAGPPGIVVPSPTRFSVAAPTASDDEPTPSWVWAGVHARGPPSLVL